MKKTVSINIGGIIFHIEEDGYEKLKNYLESVTKYFESFEDSGEIIADIESRIAELFLAKLSGGRQTVNLEDVEELITTMGTTRDFDATIDIEESPGKEEHDKEEETSSASTSEEKSTKKLYRDTKRRIFGGVAAGIAYYFKVDPLWIRLLFILLFINVLIGGVSGATFLAYIILWIVIPPNNELEEDKKVKKLFRNSEERVLGGVASGIAAYFGTDIAVIRLLFVLSIFLGGAGIIIYIILWIITPEARSITEKMQMQGEPVTLSNIEENVKKSLNVREGEESPFVKILLFPFRLIALLLNGLARILGPVLMFLVEAIRILFGASLVIIGFVLMIGLISAALVFMGLDPWMWDNYPGINEFPIDFLRGTLEKWTIIIVFLTSFIPALAVSLLGLVIIVKRSVLNAYVGWSLFAIWVLALIGASFTIPRQVQAFANENEYRSEKVYELTQATPTLYLNDLGNIPLDLVELRLRGHEDSTYQITQMITSRGRTRAEAEENAKNTGYKIERKGEDFYFDSKITLGDSSKFRFQEVDVTMYIPFGKVFRMDEDLADILTNTLHRSGYSSYQMENNDWVFEREGLKCLTCPTQKIDRENDKSSREYGDYYRNKEQISYPFEDFNELKVASYFDIEIKQGDEYSISLRGDDDELDNVYLNQIGETLKVNYKENNWEWWSDEDRDKIGLFITMPELEYVELKGSCNGEITGFDSEHVHLEFTGASDVYINIAAEELRIDLTGASKVNLKGRGERLEANLLGASELSGFDYIAEDVMIDAKGASSAEIYASENLNLTADGVSKIKYRGTTNVRTNESGLSTIKRD